MAGVMANCTALYSMQGYFRSDDDHISMYVAAGHVYALHLQPVCCPLELSCIHVLADGEIVGSCQKALGNCSRLLILADIIVVAHIMYLPMWLT